MKILVHSVQLPHLENNLSLWRKIQDKGHKLLFVVFPRNLPINDEVIVKFIKKGFSVLNGKDISFKEIIKSFPPDIYFPIKNSTTSWKTICRENQISSPVVTLQDSFSSLKGSYAPTKKISPQNISFPWYFVWGNHHKEKLIRGGIPEERIIITGNPAWDYCFNPTGIDKKFILFLGGTDFDYIKDLLMVKVYKEFEKKFVFKNHPVHHEWFETVASWLFRLNRVTIEYEEETSELIKKSEVVVTTTSTCAIESMLLDKPTIIIDVGKNSNKFLKSGRVITRSYYCFREELSLCIRGIEDRSKINPFLEEVAFKNDGKASERIIDQIEKIQRR
jgi:hypothetical protein